MEATPLALTLNGRPIDAGVPPELFEWQPAELACAPPPGTTLALQVGDLLLEPFLRPGESLWRWRWNPQNGVGLHTLRLRLRRDDGTGEELVLRLRVVPRKIDQQAYQALLADMQGVARTLAYSLGALGEGASVPTDAVDPTPLETTFATLDAGLARVEQALAAIARRPHELLQTRPERQPLGEATALAPDLAAQLPHLPAEPAPAELLPELQRALRPEGGLLPQELPTTRAAPSHDSYENRLARQLLVMLGARLRAFARQLEAERGRLARNSGYVEAEHGRLPVVERLLERVRQGQSRLRALQSLPFLAEVGPLRQFHGPTPLIQRDSRYRQVYQLWRELRRSPLLDPTSDLLALPIHELPRLYEVWCALRLATALLRLPGATLAAQALLAPDEGDEAAPTLTLPEGAPLLRLGLGDAALTLRYQPRYRPLQQAEGVPKKSADLVSLDRHTRVPDLALELRCGAEIVAWLFDAKYRLDAGGGVPQQALDDAYSYLGSVGRPDGTRAARGAFLLYPGRGAAERYPSGVGALPLLPGAADNLDPLLRDLLTDACL